MTNGVMIGRIVIARRSRCLGSLLRRTTSAKARPNSVVSRPTKVASATVCHATPPLFHVPNTQSKLQMAGLNTF